ncbi:hypothetical protein GQ55_7G086200 [Panicum hallii var. hallii]|uniref:Reverse transcriptase zinc-binding domain-containing protein n=1 Tax=Panicum hallii var. hallii TaxID=1504633 RepID=A0A2T7CT66_9POAL|nr:hypothetical protein GQ55_7G086200 [Panicum hallii var. hallii]
MALGGGLGFTNKKVMNECLLSKWIFKLERGDTNICLDLLRKKYLGSHEVKSSCQRGLKHAVNDGKKTRFWHDVWLGECPLRISFSNFFEMYHQQNCSVHQALGTGEVDLKFRRNFAGMEEIEWEGLLRRVEDVVISHSPDSVTWALERSGLFTTSSLYRELQFPGVTNRYMMDIWEACH